MCSRVTKKKKKLARRKANESPALSPAYLGFRSARLAAGTQLSHAVLSARSFHSDSGYNPVLHIENLHGLCGSAILAVARSFGRMAHGPRGAQLFHDGVLEFGECNPPGAGPGNVRKRSDDTH